MSFSRRCIIAVGVFAALSCNGDRPTQPSSDTPTPGPQFSSTQIGGGTLGSPGTTTGGGGATGWTPMGSTVPNAFILIQVTGKIDIATNQACSDTFVVPCQYPLSGESVGPMGDSYGWLKVSVKEVGGSTVGLSGPVGGSSAEGLIYGMGGVVQASRTGAAQNGQSCMANPVHPGDVTNCPKPGATQTYVEVGSYLLIGSQSVTILKIDPLSAQATPSTVLQGGKITFTATVDPHLPTSTLQWYWVPGETGSGQDGNPQGTLTGGGYIGCYGQTTCTYTPLNSGRMYVEGKLVNHWTHKGTSVTVNPMQLNATPGNGYAMDTVTFTAQIGGGLTVYAWNWTPDPTSPEIVGRVTAPKHVNLHLPPRGGNPGLKGGPSYFVANAPGACHVGYNDCETPVPVSGTEEITVVINGLKVKTSAHVTMQPLALKLQAAPEEGTPSFPATFTPQVIPSRPYTVVSWTWKADVAPGATTSCPASDAVCKTIVKESGTMTVTAMVDGQSMTASAHVIVIKCPTGIPMLDDTAFRNMARRQWAASNPNGPIQNRKERMSAGFNVGGVELANDELDASVTPCSNSDLIPYPYPGHLDWWFHTHPFSPGDTLPDNCKDANHKNVTYGYDTKTYGGPSYGDLTRSASSYPGATGIILDAVNLYLFQSAQIDPQNPMKLLPYNVASNVISIPRNFLDNPACIQ